MILYRLACDAETVVRASGVVRDLSRGSSPFLGIHPKSMAPVVRLDRGERVLTLMRWMPDLVPDEEVAPARRCLVPFTAFSIYPAEPPPNNGKLRPVRFSLGEGEPVGFFAGAAVAGGFAILEAAANAEVAAVNPVGMPIVLATEDDREAWLTAPWEEVSALLRPLPDGALTATPARKWVWKLPPRVADHA